MLLSWHHALPFVIRAARGGSTRASLVVTAEEDRQAAPGLRDSSHGAWPAWPGALTWGSLRTQAGGRSCGDAAGAGHPRGGVNWPLNSEVQAP